MRVARETYAQLAGFRDDTAKLTKMGSRPAPHFAFVSDGLSDGAPGGVQSGDDVGHAVRGTTRDAAIVQGSYAKPLDWKFAA